MIIFCLINMKYFPLISKKRTHLLRVFTSIIYPFHFDFFLKLFRQKYNFADSFGLLLSFVLFKGSYCRPFVECLRLFL